MREINNNDEQYNPTLLTLDEEIHLLRKMSRLQNSIYKWELQLEMLEVDNTSKHLLMSNLDSCNQRLVEVLDKLERLDSSLSIPFD
jgi:hypothetical protein